MDTQEPANWSLFKAERWSLSEINFSIEIIWGHLECSYLEAVFLESVHSGCSTVLLQ